MRTVTPIFATPSEKSSPPRSAATSITPGHSPAVSLSNAYTLPPSTFGFLLKALSGPTDGATGSEPQTEYGTAACVAPQGPSPKYVAERTLSPLGADTGAKVAKPSDVTCQETCGSWGTPRKVLDAAFVAKRK